MVHYENIHHRSKVWGHPDSFVFSMKTHTFIYQLNRKYSKDINKVRNNDFYFKNVFCSSNFKLKGRLIASLSSITVFSCANIIALGFSTPPLVF